MNVDEVTVTTPRALALDVLSDAEAMRWSGREPRLLTAYEELFLLEDMKACGLRPKRLREMLKFFYRSWTELADDDPNWLVARRGIQCAHAAEGRIWPPRAASPSLKRAIWR